MALGRQISLTNNVASRFLTVIATSSQTDFNITGGYNINHIDVFRNGVKLSSGIDFRASDGATVTLITAAALNDEIQFELFDDFRVANAIQPNVSDQTISGNLTVTGTLAGASIGIQSGGTQVAIAKTLNFIGAGNTFLNQGNGTVDISISGGGGDGGAGIGTVIKYSNNKSTPFSYIDKFAKVDSNLLIDSTNAGINTSIVVSVIPNIEVVSGVALTVGAGKTMVIDVLQIGDL
tara:strand:+ start:6783 stop:7487 length:705 start_codon:yes stop_codon:yes gene_type:complete